MAKLEDRPVDSGLAQLRGKDDAAAVEWWKQRYALLAGIPTDIARAGAVAPQLRDFARLPEAERSRLAVARVKALMAIPGDQRARVLAGRKVAAAIDPALVRADTAFLRSAIGHVSGADALDRDLGD
jgi:hypothetical protein